MKRLINYLSAILIINIVSCTKENNTMNTPNVPTTTYSYLRTQHDSSSITNNYFKTFYYSSNLLSKDSSYQISTGYQDVYIYPVVGNIINRSYTNGTIIHRYVINSGIISSSNYILAPYNLLKTFNYDSDKKLLTFKDSAVNSIVYDTLTWNRLNLSSRKTTYNFNNGNKWIYEYQFTYDLTKKNNLLNQYRGQSYYGYDSQYSSDNICTAFTSTNTVYTAGNPTPTITTNNFLLTHSYDSLNRIIQLNISKNSTFYSTHKYTYY